MGVYADGDDSNVRQETTSEPCLDREGNVIPGISLELTRTETTEYAVMDASKRDKKSMRRIGKGFSRLFSAKYHQIRDFNARGLAQPLLADDARRLEDERLRERRQAEENYRRNYDAIDWST